MIYGTAGAGAGAELRLLTDDAPAERALDGLDEAQRDAATHADRRLVLLGCAGAGKTRTILARFRWLVARGCATERIALVVPSASRASALRAAIEQTLEDGYEQLHVLDPSGLAALVLRGSRSGDIDPAHSVLGVADRLALMLERIDELPLASHDFAGAPGALLVSFLRRIDRLKAECVDAGQFAAWAGDRTGPDAELEREFAEVYSAHERLLREAGVRDAGDLIRDALAFAQRCGAAFEHLLIDDAQELDLAPLRLVLAVGARATVTIAGDPLAAVNRFRGAGEERLRSLMDADARVLVLRRSRRCRDAVWRAAGALLSAGGITAGPGRMTSDPGGAAADPGGEVVLWRCANERSQAQAVAADVERLVAREGLAPGRIAVLVPSVEREGQAVAAALSQRGVPHRLIGRAALFQRAVIRDLLAWLRLLVDPADAGAVVRALARPPIELRSVDIARCTQIARRRRLDMVSALAAALEAPQVPPEARERIRAFLKLHRACAAGLDTSRPDVYVHRLIERLGLRRQQLFSAHADVVERLRALASFGELAAAYVARAPQATARQFAHSVGAMAELGLPDAEEPDLGDAAAVQVVSLWAAGGLEVDQAHVVGLHAELAAPPPEAIPDELLADALAAAEPEHQRRRALAQVLYVAATRARERLVLSYPAADDRGRPLRPLRALEAVRAALGCGWQERPEELFGPAEALQSTFVALRDELLDQTLRAGGRLGELRLDTDLDVSHAVVRYLELLKVAALLARPEGQSAAEALRDVNSRILQAVTAEQREIFESSALDDYLLDAERDARRRAQAIAARDEPSLEPFLPRRGEGVVLSATDIDTYRTCPLKYKFARVFRIPQEPTLHQRFGILVHQVMERFHASDASTLPELLGLLQDGWRRGGFGDSDEERQLRGKAAAALTRYHERLSAEPARPVWFERQFAFRLGPHLLRGRVDRVDQLPGGEYELIDYKTGRPKTAAQLADDVQLSLYAVGAREAWRLDTSQQAYYYLLDDVKVRVPGDEARRSEWVRELAMEVAEGIVSQGFEPTPSFAACSACDYRLACPAAER
ncbi:MAG TPA: ATP-dependent DNA helicase [Solirubrobacteraceae bacterium]|nr:ATP-dependent DNA helicase [Solirubrobacteraceae bacterium]